MFVENSSKNYINGKGRNLTRKSLKIVSFINEIWRKKPKSLFFQHPFYFLDYCLIFSCQHYSKSSQISETKISKINLQVFIVGFTNKFLFEYEHHWKCLQKFRMICSNSFWNFFIPSCLKLVKAND